MSQKSLVIVLAIALVLVMVEAEAKRKSAKSEHLWWNLRSLFPLLPRIPFTVNLSPISYNKQTIVNT